MQAKQEVSYNFEPIVDNITTTVCAIIHPTVYSGLQPLSSAVDIAQTYVNPSAEQFTVTDCTPRTPVIEQIPGETN